jgi:acetyl esterase/lipase
MSKHILEPAAQSLAVAGDSVGGDMIAALTILAVRYNGILHDFMMLNPLRGTRAATAAIAQAIEVSQIALGTAKPSA